MTARAEIAPSLKLVQPEPEQPKDITMLLRREIEQRDWSRCHIDADRRGPINLGEQRRWRWL